MSETTWAGYPLRFDAGTPCESRSEWCAYGEPHEHGGFACDESCPCRSDAQRWRAVPDVT